MSNIAPLWIPPKLLLIKVKCNSGIF